MAGQNSKDPPEVISDKICAKMQGFFSNPGGEAYGKNTGTTYETGTDYINWGCEPLKIHDFLSSDGNTYILVWSDDGTIRYRNDTTNGAVATLKNDLITMVPPCFVNVSNDHIICLCGMDGVFKITVAGAALAITTMPTIPASNFGFIDNGCLMVAEDTSLIRSAMGEFDRWTPNVDDGDSYTNDMRLVFSAVGVEGECIAAVSWKGIKFLWTQRDLFVAIWDGLSTCYPSRLPGYGMFAYESYALMDDRIRFFSNYKQGTVLEIHFGGKRKEGDETFSISNNLSITVTEPAGWDKVSDILRATPKATTGATLQRTVLAVDTQADWQNSAKIASAAGFDFTTTQGWAFLKGSALAAISSVYSGGTNPNVNVFDNSHSGVRHLLSDFFTSWASLGTTETYDHDGSPTTQPATTPTPTYLAVNYQTVISESPIGLDDYRQIISITMVSRKLYVGGQSFLNTNNNDDFIEAPGWTRYTAKTPLQGSHVEIRWTFHLVVRILQNGGWVYRDVDIEFKRYVVLNAAKNVTDIYLYGVSSSITGQCGVGYGFHLTLLLGEVNVYAYGESTGLITTTVMNVTNLNLGKLSLGSFRILYEGLGVDRTGGLTGSSPTGVEVGIGITNSPAQWGTDGSPTTNGSIAVMTANELKGGMRMSRLVTGAFAGVTETGILYVRVRVPFTLDTTLTSAMVDALIWDFFSFTGTSPTRKVIYPMFTWQDKTILCLRAATASEQCDRAIILNEAGGCTVFDGVSWLAGRQMRDKTLVTSGQSLGRFAEGTDNRKWVTNSNDTIDVERIIDTKRIKGEYRSQMKGMKCAVLEYTPNEGAALFTSGDVVIQAGE